MSGLAPIQCKMQPPRSNLLVDGQDHTGSEDQLDLSTTGDQTPRYLTTILAVATPDRQ